MRSGTRTLRRPCPLCNGRQGRPVWEEAGQSYVRCPTCHAVFTDIEEEAYARGRRNVWDEPLPDDDSLGFYGDARAAAHAAFLDALPPWGDRRLLDVGCGLGFFLERARARGWHVQGCEPSVSWAELAQQRLGVGSVTCGTVEKLAHEPRSFDLITAWDVIEHVFDPVPFLRSLRQMLAPGGRVFLRTPNLDYVLPVYRIRRRIGHEVELGPLNHVVYFTSRTMRLTLSSAGLEAMDWLALPPPQVATFETDPARRYAPRRSAVVGLKNFWARGSRLAVGASRGRVVLASDLDVLARAT